MAEKPKRSTGRKTSRPVAGRASQAKSAPADAPSRRRGKGNKSEKPVRPAVIARGKEPGTVEQPEKIAVGAAAAPAVAFSNLEKVLYPSTGFTKGLVLDYYRQIAPAILPHLQGRPLTLKRYPNGVDAPFFYEKRCPSYRPAWVKTSAVSSNKEGGVINFCLVQDVASLLWVANLASLELHTLLGREPDPEMPTSMVFDLDPGEPADVLDCVRVALQMRKMFSKLGLELFAKTSGSKGLHLSVPLNTQVTFEQTKSFARSVALLMEREDPKRVTSVMRKDVRNGRVFIDWSQNDNHKTTVCAYSLRARQRPTVSTPVTWEEVERAGKKKDASALSFETDEVLKRVGKFGDLFAEVVTLRQELPALAPPNI